MEPSEKQAGFPDQAPPPYAPAPYPVDQQQRPQVPYPQANYPQAPPAAYPQAPAPQGAYPQAPPAAQGAYPQAPAPQGAYPQGAYPQAAGPHVQYTGGPTATTTVVTVQPSTVVTVVGGRMGRNPQVVDCPQCHARVTTSTTHRVGCMPWLVCFLICVIACVIFPFALLGCCFIPFCIDDLKNVEHTCPNCNAMIGMNSKM